MLRKYICWFFIFIIFRLILIIEGIIFRLNDNFIMLEYELFFLNSVSFTYVLIFDIKSLIFISIVIFISSLVILYRYQYISDVGVSSLRFLFIVSLFVFRIILIIIRPNLLRILLGWDGLGLVSYCLVIYYNSNKRYLAGIITCLTNRLGDAGILVRIRWIFSFGSWHFILLSEYFSLTLIFLIIISCFTKRAQIPFSCWLPAAIAAPTPVSALVHSSTLVTAGIYLLIRFFNELNLNYNFIIILGLFTIYISSICANREFDLKKIIAFSTLRQLGLIILSIFLGLTDYSYFHMLTHAVFKSLLFLCSGIIIYNLIDNQDIRSIGSCCIIIPLTTSCFNISNLALCGIPFLSAFYSKDMIIESLIFNGLNFFLFVIIYLRLGLTCCYTSRLIYYTCYKKAFVFSVVNKKLNLDFIRLRVILLTIFSIVFGCIIQWIINLKLNFIFLPIYLKILSIISTFTGIWIGYELSTFNFNLNYSLYLFNRNIWFIQTHINYIYSLFFNYARVSYKIIFWGEYYRSYNIYSIKLISDFFHVYLNRRIRIYLITFIIWFLIIIYNYSLYRALYWRYRGEIFLVIFIRKIFFFNENKMF